MKVFAKRVLDWGVFGKHFATGSVQLAAIKKLRDLSGAPIGDVKKALEETQYDLGTKRKLNLFC